MKAYTSRDFRLHNQSFSRSLYLQNVSSSHTWRSILRGFPFWTPSLWWTFLRWCPPLIFQGNHWPLSSSDNSWLPWESSSRNKPVALSLTYGADSGTLSSLIQSTCKWPTICATKICEWFLLMPIYLYNTISLSNNTRTVAERTEGHMTARLNSVAQKEKRG